MVVKRSSIEERLKELDEILQELNKYREVDAASLNRDLSQRWIIERGLIAAATLILDIVDHILVAHFGLYQSSYEDDLAAIHEKEVISDDLYRQIKGLGGFRNVLVYLYQDIDTEQVVANYQKVFSAFPQFTQEILAWVDQLPSDEIAD